MAMAHRSAIRVVAALRADDLVDLGLQQLVQHPQADADAQRQQPLPRRASELAESLQHRLGQPLDALVVGHDRRGRYGPHAVGPPVLVDLASHPSRSQRDRTGAGGPPPSSSTTYGTTSLCNRRDYTWRMKINALLGKRMSLEEIAEKRSAEKVPTIHGTNTWTAASVRKASVS